MIKNERFDKILQILESQHYSSIDNLAKLLYVAPVTIRRDLKKLEEDGLVSTCYGGVSLPQNVNTDTPWIVRKNMNNVAKKLIAKRAASIIPDNSTIFLDGSSTVSYIIGHIKPEQNITIITNGIHALSLAAQQHLKTYTTGGRLVDNSLVFVGSLALKSINSLHADLMFFSSNGISADGQITDQSDAETELRLAMLANSDKHYFLCDSSKLNKSFLFHVCSVSELDDVICDIPVSF